MPSDKDVVTQARELIVELGQDRKSAFCKAVTHKVVTAKTESVIRALADEVERLRNQSAEGRRAFKNNDAEWWQQFED